MRPEDGIKIGGRSAPKESRVDEQMEVLECTEIHRSLWGDQIRSPARRTAEQKGRRQHRIPRSTAVCHSRLGREALTSSPLAQGSTSDRERGSHRTGLTEEIKGTVSIQAVGSERHEEDGTDPPSPDKWSVVKRGDVSRCGRLQ